MVCKGLILGNLEEGSISERGPIATLNIKLPHFQIFVVEVSLYCRNDEDKKTGKKE